MNPPDFFTLNCLFCWCRVSCDPAAALFPQFPVDMGKEEFGMLTVVYGCGLSHSWISDDLRSSWSNCLWKTLQWDFKMKRWNGHIHVLHGWGSVDVILCDIVWLYNFQSRRRVCHYCMLQLLIGLAGWPTSDLAFRSACPQTCGGSVGWGGRWGELDLRDVWCSSHEESDAKPWGCLDSLFWGLFLLDQSYPCWSGGGRLGS